MTLFIKYHQHFPSLNTGFRFSFVSLVFSCVLECLVVLLACLLCACLLVVCLRASWVHSTTHAGLLLNTSSVLWCCCLTSFLLGQTPFCFSDFSTTRGLTSRVERPWFVERSENSSHRLIDTAQNITSRRTVSTITIRVAGIFISFPCFVDLSHSTTTILAAAASSPAVDPFIRLPAVATNDALVCRCCWSNSQELRKNVVRGEKQSWNFQWRHSHWPNVFSSSDSEMCTLSICCYCWESKERGSVVGIGCWYNKKTWTNKARTQWRKFSFDGYFFWC